MKETLLKIYERDLLQLKNEIESYPDDDSLSVYYPDYDCSVEYEDVNVDQLQLAYATTVHKAQGAEYPAVVIVLHDSHNNMLQRNLMYTAITRAKRICAIVGTRSAIEKSVRNNREISRNTSLAERIQECVHGQSS